MVRPQFDDFDDFVSRAAGDYLSDTEKQDALKWVTYLRLNRGLSLNTVRAYVISLARLAKWARENNGNIDILDQEDIESWLRDLAIFAHNGTETRILRLAAVRSFYEWRERVGAGASPAKHVRSPKRPHRAPEKYSTAQLQRLFAACDVTKPRGVRNLALLLFMYATGARISEVIGLNLIDIETTPRTGYARFRGKGAKDRVVSFNGPALLALTEWLTTRDGISAVDPDAVWLGMSGRSKGHRLGRGGIENIFYRAGMDGGIARSAIGVHKMRATFATDLYDAGVDIERIRIVMGHNDITTTRRYLAISEKQLKVRMPAERQKDLLGLSASMPRWLRKKLEDRGMSATGEPH